VHCFDEAFERLGEDFITLGAAEPSRFLKIGLSEAATGALQLSATACLFYFLGGTQAQQKVSQRKTCRIVDTLCFGAFFAQVNLLHLVARDLGQMHCGFFFLADAAQHKFSNRISARLTF
jgi:hypothetical protein